MQITSSKLLILSAVSIVQFPRQGISFAIASTRRGRFLTTNSVNSRRISTTVRSLSSSLQNSIRSTKNHHQQQDSNNMSTMTPQETEKTIYPIEMSEDERYLFDLNGYVIIRNVLSAEEVQEANRVIEKHQHEMVERKEEQLRNAKTGTSFYGTGPGRKDLGGCLEWEENDSSVFKSILAHPRLLPLFHGILGQGYRMDHLPLIIAQDEGAEGFQLHGGTVDCSSGNYNHYLAYTCHMGTIRSALLGCNVMLTDHNYGDGGFCVVNGSHKSNFKMPKGMTDGSVNSDYITQPVTKAGDVVLFSEGTVHGALPWTVPNRQRRCALFRFSPSTNVYGRSYFSNQGTEGETTASGGWPTKIYNNLSDAQKAVLEPPYANRLDRPIIDIQPSSKSTSDDAASPSPESPQVKISSRQERKKKHDSDVFGTKYF